MKCIARWFIRVALAVCAASGAWAANGPTQPVRLLFGGDVTLTDGYEAAAPRVDEDPLWAFKHLKPLFDQADVVMVNCEMAITTAKSKVQKQFNFRMDPRRAVEISGAGINLVTLANNHVYDYGAPGLSDTLHTLDAAGIEHVGAGMNLADARRPVWRTIKGRRVAFLGYGNYSPASASRPGVAYRRPEYLREDIPAAKAAGADLIVVFFHWGIERAKEPQPCDVDLARLAVDLGADVVVGAHPHVLQRTEHYHGKLIDYSLGNLVFGGDRHGPGTGAMLLVTWLPDGRLTDNLLPIANGPELTHYQPHLLRASGKG